MTYYDEVYVPTVKEIYFRANMLRLMQHLDWEVSLIESVMMYDTPDVETVSRLIARYGPEEAYTIILEIHSDEGN